MATKILKDKQRYNAPAVLILEGLLFTALLIALFMRGLPGANDPMPWWLPPACLAVIGIALYYYSRLKLVISITEEGIRWKLSPWHTRKDRVKWADVEAYEFIQTPEAARWSGWDVHYNTLEENYTLCGRNGLRLVLRNGRDLFLGSRALLERKEEIIGLIEQARGQRARQEEGLV